MNRHRWAHDHEQCVDGLSVDRVEIDRVAQQTQGDESCLDVKHDGIADVQDRYAVADAGGSHRFSGFEDAQ